MKTFMRAYRLLLIVVLIGLGGFTTCKGSGRLGAALQRLRAAAASDMMADGTLADAKAQLGARVSGPIRVLRVYVYPDWARFFVQDPKKPENVDAYDYRNGLLQGPTAVQLSGGGSVSKNVFNLDDVDLSSVPRVVTAVVSKAGLEGGTLSTLSIERRLPFSKDVRIRASVEGTRRKASGEADTKGRLLTWSLS
jgi:hypothetical protein